MPADAHHAAAADRRRVPLTKVLRAVKDMADLRGSSLKQILGRLNDDAPVGREIDKIRLALALKKGVAAGALAVRGGRYRLANPDDDRELACGRRRRRSSCRRRRRRSCRRRRRRSCRRRRRRSCRRRRRRSCRRRRRRSCRRRRRSCRRRRRRSCRRRRRRSCRRRRRRSCRRRRRRCSIADELSEAASLANRAGEREPSRGPGAGGVGVPVGVAAGGGAGAGGGAAGPQRAAALDQQSQHE